MHRPTYDWEKTGRRHLRGSVEQRIYDGVQRLIAVRKTMPAFADFNNRELIDVGNEHLFSFIRNNASAPDESVLVIANFDDHPQQLDLADLGNRARFSLGPLRDVASGESPAQFQEQVVIPPHRFYWLVAMP